MNFIPTSKYKCLFTLIILTLCAFNTQAQLQDWNWVKGIGGLANESLTGIGMDNQKNTYVSGGFYESASISNSLLKSYGNTDIFLASYDVQGQCRWVKSIGGKGIEIPGEIAVDSIGNTYITGVFWKQATLDNIVLTADSIHAAFIAKYDSSGNLKWAKKIDVALDVNYSSKNSIAIDRQGNAVISGFYSGKAIFGNTIFTGKNSAYIARYDGLGNLLWAKKAEGNQPTFIFDIASDQDGNSYFLGETRALTLNVDTILLNIPGPGCSRCNPYPPHGLMAKFDPNGNVQWARVTAAGNNTLTLDRTKAIYVGGGGSVPTVTKLNTNGTIAWTKSPTVTGTSTIYPVICDITSDQHANIYLSSSFSGNLSFDNKLVSSSMGAEGLVAKFDSTGKIIWIKASGNPTDDYGKKIVADNEGNVYAGFDINSGSNTGFDKTPVTTYGKMDVVVAYLTTNDTTKAPRQPGMITGNIEPCAGTTQQYFVPASIGASYKWTLSGGGTITSNENKVSIQWITKGQYILTCSALNIHGISDPKNINISVNDASACITPVNYNCDSLINKGSLPSDAGKITFINTNVGFLLGSGIRKTIDGGETWRAINVDLNLQFRSIAFTDANTGYIGCNKGVMLKTTDQGETWNQLTSGMEGTNTIFLSLQFINKTTGWASAFPHSMVASTNDEGKTWSYTSIHKDTSSTWIQDVAFLDSDTGIALLYPADVYRTQDGGKTWKEVVPLFSTNTYLYDIEFLDNNTGFVAGDILLKTTNAGETWNQLTSSGGSIGTIKFINNNTAFITGSFNSEAGFLYKSTDGGNTWNDIISFTWKEFSDIYLRDNNKGYVLNDRILWKTNNGGSTWAPHTAGMSLSSLFFLNNQVIFGTGEPFAIFKSTDDGQTWTNVFNYSYNYSLNSVAFSDNSHGFAVGDIGKFVKSTDGGNTWNTDNLGTGLSLYDIKFTSPTIGYIAGDQGLIMKTTNGGVTWQTLNSGVVNQLKKLHFISDSIGFAVGATGMIIRTKDGGNNWEVLDFVTARDLNDIKFINNSTGYAVGGDYMTNSVVIKTTDGGNTWKEDVTSFPNAVNSLCFDSSGHAFMIGDRGLFVKIDMCDNNPTSVTSVFSSSPVSQTDATIYPNPNSGQFSLLTNTGNNSQITIFNTMGRQLKSFKGGNTIEVDLGPIPSGLYFLSIASENGILTKKIIVK